MDFNVKKIASGAGLFFTRAVQFTEEKLGQAEKTELDAHFENLMSRADCTKNWTEKIYRQTEVLLQPNPSMTSIQQECVGFEMKVLWSLDLFLAGSTLIEVGECERRLGAAEREFLQTSAISFLSPLRNFLEGDWRTILKERRLLENLRLDLDACKTRLKKAKVAEAKAAMAPDFQETRPRNYVLSASASALWSEEVEKAEHELRVAQTEFDRQAEVTRLLLEGISSTHVNHLRCLHEFVEAQAAYYKRCHFHMQELQKELGRLPNAFALNSHPSVATAGSASEGISSPVETDTLKIEEVQAPATGTRKAKVLYDYDAADSSELSLLADEVRLHYLPATSRTNNDC
ncbi:endophilin-B2-like [Morone saxatilis]|uniref:endophilin-B2-like n=1 Tax=Morone saxatilis TaxID=34816 RepID=UPI0015E25707|nr:endophilin-B2-like [Morone saxatilis]